VRELIRGWYRRVPGAEPITRFVFLWICFNAWLAFESQKTTDRGMLDWLVDATSDSSELRAACKAAESDAMFMTSWTELASMSPIYDPRPDGRPKYLRIDSPDNFRELVFAVYQVRCNLFHGSKTISDQRDERLVALCADIVNTWVEALSLQWC
jgi:hypothetical protein